MNKTHSPVDSILEQAACIARRSKEATGTIEPIENYKRRQIKELILKEIQRVKTDYNS